MKIKTNMNRGWAFIRAWAFIRDFTVIHLEYSAIQNLNAIAQLKFCLIRLSQNTETS